MNDKNIGISVIGIIIIVALWLHINTLNKKIETRNEMINNCSEQIDDANDNIDEVNGQIEDAQSQAWSDYDNMGNSLENLTSSDNITNNCYIPTNN